MPQFRVTTDRLNLRNGPGTDKAVITQLSANAVVEKLESSADDQWFRIKADKDGQSFEGWVAARFLAPRRRWMDQSHRQFRSRTPGNPKARQQALLQQLAYDGWRPAYNRKRHGRQRVHDARR